MNRDGDMFIFCSYFQPHIVMGLSWQDPDVKLTPAISLLRHNIQTNGQREEKLGRDSGQEIQETPAELLSH